MSDVDYFRMRAEAERALAQSSAHANVASIHEELARAYDMLGERERERLGAAPRAHRHRGIAGR